MATPQLSLLYQPFNAIIDSLVLDASIKEEHVSEVEVTDHAVEQGSAITDHARPKPRELTIEGVVSNTPLSNLQVSRATTFEGVAFTSNTSANAVRGMPGNAETAYTTLLGLRGKIVDVVTALETYTNMLMLSLKVPRDKDTGDVLKFEAKFKQVTIVKNAVTVVATKVPRVQKQANNGAGSGFTTTPVAPKGAPKALAALAALNQSAP